MRIANKPLNGTTLINCLLPIVLVLLFFFGRDASPRDTIFRLDTLRSFCEVSIWLLVVWSTYVFSSAQGG